MSVTIEVIGLDELMAKLTKSVASQTLKPALLKAGSVFKEWSQLNRFVQGGGKGKSKYGGSVRPDILTSRSGRLRGSITVKANDDLSVSIGTNIEYARIHEFGGVLHRYPRQSLTIPNRRLKNVLIDVAGYGKAISKRKGQFSGGTTRGRGASFRAYDINMPARPFLTPAIKNQNNINLAVAIINKAISQELSK